MLKVLLLSTFLATQVDSCTGSLVDAPTVSATAQPLRIEEIGTDKDGCVVRRFSDESYMRYYVVCPTSLRGGRNAYSFVYHVKGSHDPEAVAPVAYWREASR